MSVETSSSESTPVSTEPTTSSQVTQPEVQAAAASPAVDTSPATGGTPADTTSSQSATAAPDNPRAEIDELAASLGYQPGDFANFSDVASARAAVAAHLNNIARQGLQGSQVPQPPAPAPSVPDYTGAVSTPPPAPNSSSSSGQLDLAAFGLSEDDPAAKAIRVLEAQVAQGTGQVAAMANAVRQLQTQSQAANHQSLVARAEEVVSGFESPVYGVAGRRTAAQEWATQRLFDIADALATAEHNRGSAISPLQHRLARAKYIDESNFSASQPAVGGQPFSPAQALPEQSNGTGPQVESMKLTDSWSDNPELMALVGQRGL